ncbi:hypothetical protein B0A49_02372 [Cryomyces minteri]|uniref:Uncharacterized protein n=1 Tax=Cryomyces minteri TaxID=331657 RepID=A0A4U0XTZ1_9PEZI|nr:hypothetical protein B0A49_02372 [Cryomyces minteri]
MGLTTYIPNVPDWLHGTTSRETQASDLDEARVTAPEGSEYVAEEDVIVDRRASTTPSSGCSDEDPLPSPPVYDSALVVCTDESSTPGPTDSGSQDIYSTPDTPALEASLNSFQRKSFKRMMQRRERLMMKAELEVKQNYDHQHRREEAKEQVHTYQPVASIDYPRGWRMSYAAKTTKAVAEAKPPVFDPNVDGGIPSEAMGQFIFSDLRNRIEEMKIKTLLILAQDAIHRRDLSAQTFSMDAYHKANVLQYKPLIGRCTFWLGVTCCMRRQFSEAREYFEEARLAKGYYIEGETADVWRDRCDKRAQHSPWSTVSEVEMESSPTPNWSNQSFDMKHTRPLNEEIEAAMQAEPSPSPRSRVFQMPLRSSLSSGSTKSSPGSRNHSRKNSVAFDVTVRANTGQRASSYSSPTSPRRDSMRSSSLKSSDLGTAGDRRNSVNHFAPKQKIPTIPPSSSRSNRPPLFTIPSYDAQASNRTDHSDDELCPPLVQRGLSGPDLPGATFCGRVGDEPPKMSPRRMSVVSADGKHRRRSSLLTLCRVDDETRKEEEEADSAESTDRRDSSQSEAESVKLT